MEDLQQTKALRPIYNAIDQNQYNRAYKLTLQKPQCDWPITIALRAHASERCGRVLDCLLDLRDLLLILSSQSPSLCWVELEDKICLLKLSDAGEEEKKLHAEEGTALGGSVSSSIVLGTNNRDGKVGPKSSKTAVKYGAGSKANEENVMENNIDNETTPDFDLVDYLDIPKWKRKELLASRKYNASIRTSIVGGAEAVINETTLDTIAVTLKTLRMYETMTKMYSAVAELLGESDNLTAHAKKEAICRNLVHAYHSSMILSSDYTISRYKVTDFNLEVIEDMGSLSTSVAELLIHDAISVIGAYESAQISAMQLTRQSGEKIYFRWCAHAALMHYESCKILQHILGKLKSSDYDELKRKVITKLGMLPRLAQSILHRLKGEHERQFGDFEEVSLYVKSLLVQEDNNAAISALSLLNCSYESFTRMNKSQDDLVRRQQLTDSMPREAVKLTADTLVKMGRQDEAFNLVSDRLSTKSSGQWGDWLTLFEFSKISSSCLHESLSKCETVVRHLITTNRGNDWRLLRNPHLFLVLLEVERVRNRLVLNCNSLSAAIFDYFVMFGAKSSCCFQDIREYIATLVHFTGPSSDKCAVSEELDHFITNIWKISRECIQETKTSSSDNGDKYRNQGLTTYVCSLKISYEIWFQLTRQKDKYEDHNEIDKFMLERTPSTQEILDLWQSATKHEKIWTSDHKRDPSLSDDLFLLVIQLFLYRSQSWNASSKFSYYSLVAALMEHALDESPHNMYIKIAAVNLYCRFLGVHTRAYEIFKAISLKQIQMESCSYLIISDLMSGGMYGELLEVAGNMVSFHTRCCKDIAEYIPKAFDAGYMNKGQEMIDWHRSKMVNSLQLLQAKGLVMSSAPFSLTVDGVSHIQGASLGKLHGLTGCVADREKAVKIAAQSDSFYSAASLLHELSRESLFSQLSDNRDFTVLTQFEILYKTGYPSHRTISLESLQRSIMHSILIRVVLLETVVKAPKKGKLPSFQLGDKLYKRCKSLFNTIHQVEQFLDGRQTIVSEESAFLQCALKLSRAVCVVSTGLRDGDNDINGAEDSILLRETLCVSLLDASTTYLRQIQAAFSSTKYLDSNASHVFIDYLLPLVAILCHLEKICSTFGFGKSKRQSKIGGQALCQVAHELSLVIKQVVRAFQSIECEDSSELHRIVDEMSVNDTAMVEALKSALVSLDSNNEYLTKVKEESVRSRISSKTHMESLLFQLLSLLQSFDATSS